MRSLAAALAACLQWAWWAFTASRFSGGGPRHPTYSHAVWMRWQAAQRVRAYLEH